MLFRYYIRNFVNNLVIYSAKIERFQNFKPIFSVISGTFDLEYDGQRSVKVVLVLIGFVFTKFRKNKASNKKTKNSIFIKLRFFLCLNDSLLWVTFFQNIFSNFLPTSSNSNLCKVYGKPCVDRFI